MQQNNYLSEIDNYCHHSNTHQALSTSSPPFPHLQPLSKHGDIQKSFRNNISKGEEQDSDLYKKDMQETDHSVGEDHHWPQISACNQGHKHC